MTYVHISLVDISCAVWPEVLCMAARTGALLVAASALGIITTSSSASGVGVCQPQRRVACETAYLDCKLAFPISDQDAICGCAAVYYAACLPTAGCGSTEVMTSCIEELMTLDCPDMSVCGNDCTIDDDDPLVPADSIYLPINNFGANYLRLSVCSKNLSAAKLNHFGQVSMERCADDDFRKCSLWVAPRTLTVVTFPPHVTYLRVEHCVIHAGTGDDDGDSGEEDDNDDDDGSEEEEEWKCLDEPLPVEFYGTTAYFGTTTAAVEDNDTVSSVSHWPSSVDVDFSEAVICQKDSHCPGSFCDTQQQPRTCAPKIGEHFVQSGAHFLDPRWELLEHAADD